MLQKRNPLCLPRSDKNESKGLKKEGLAKRENKRTGKNIQQQVFAGGHPPNY
jgi:hypothetical protein